MYAYHPMFIYGRRWSIDRFTIQFFIPFSFGWEGEGWLNGKRGVVSQSRLNYLYWMCNYQLCNGLRHIISLKKRAAIYWCYGWIYVGVWRQSKSFPFCLILLSYWSYTMTSNPFEGWKLAMTCLRGTCCYWGSSSSSSELPTSLREIMHQSSRKKWAFLP